MAIHTAIIAATASPWYETPAAAEAIAAIDLDELYLSRPMVVMGDGYLHFSGEGIEALEFVRRDCVAELFGATFQEACDTGRVNEYLDFDAAVPSVDDALAVHFGNPRRFGNEDPYRATLMMRSDARQKAALDRRAA